MKIREDASILPDFHFTGCVDFIDACAASLRPLPLIVCNAGSYTAGRLSTKAGDAHLRVSSPPAFVYAKAAGNSDSFMIDCRRKAGVYARREADEISFRTEAKTPGHACMPPALFACVHPSAVIKTKPAAELIGFFGSVAERKTAAGSF